MNSGRMISSAKHGYHATTIKLFEINKVETIFLIFIFREVSNAR